MANMDKIRALNTKLKTMPKPVPAPTIPRPPVDLHDFGGSYDEMRDLAAKLMCYASHQGDCPKAKDPESPRDCECGLDSMLDEARHYDLKICACCGEHASDGEGPDGDFCIDCADDMEDAKEDEDPDAPPDDEEDEDPDETP